MYTNGWYSLNARMAATIPAVQKQVGAAYQQAYREGSTDLCFKLLRLDAFVSSPTKGKEIEAGSFPV